MDPLIDEALDRPMAELVDAVAPWLRRLPASWRAEERARRLVTARIRRIRLPYGDLRLADDLPELPVRRLFPDLLATLEDQEPAALFRRFDGGVRTRYIANLVRSRQKSLELRAAVPVRSTESDRRRAQ